jgi:pimeloyl-ACP methyl ester carboxylesterase
MSVSWLGALALVAAVACATPGPRPTAPTVDLIQCLLPRPPVEARCGTLTVFEDRAARSGRVLPLRIVVLPAQTSTPARDAVFFLAGGPSQAAASSLTGEGSELFGLLRRDRDVVFVDQRGTGASGRLHCRLAGDGSAVVNAFGELLPVGRVRACRQALEARADLRLYTTSIAMDDLDDVRAALGYKTINLYGVSYGTQAALQYLRQHPTRVRSVTLAGVATPAQKFPLHFATAAQRALDALFADCASDAACHRTFPDPAGDLAATLGRFAAGPVTFGLPTADGEVTEPITMSRAVFVERLRLLLYDLETARRIPLLVHRAARGDWVPFARATWPTLGNGPMPNSMGMYLTVTCSESVTLISEEEIVRETRDTFVGEYRTRAHVQACVEWPRGSVAPDYYQPVTSSVPVLMLSGELDPATPHSDGRVAARSLPNSRQILIRHAAHAYFSDCLRELVAEFIARGSARDLDARCVEGLSRPPFVTE